MADLGEIPAGSGEKSLNGVKNLDIGVADVLSHLLQSKNEQTLLYIGVKPCAKGSIYVALEWGYLYLTFFNISNNLFDFLTSNNLGVESEAGFGM